MKTFDAASLPWTENQTHQEAELHAGAGSAVRVWVLQVPAGSAFGPLKGAGTRLFFSCMFTAGARLHLGSRIFRAMPGQVFECEPGDVFGVVNDTRQEVRFLVTQIGAAGDVQPLGKTWEEHLAEVRPNEPALLSTTSNPAAR